MSSHSESLIIPDHTLLRVIGRGSYGEVWLARNVMGTKRAVKIVRRAAFDSDRPWMREFEGIRRCEPVSRAHDGLIDILHMGRNEAEGFFYYVMELADADASGGAGETESVKAPAAGSGTGSGPDPLASSFYTYADSYRPATLASRLSSGRPLDMPDCLRLGESLAGALAFLHEQGLIHRDVKPSNILYAGGVPKLGDIGLVAEAGSSRSFVGTEGFVPLEGPGTERADIYALGKVLYEALTGMDREKFPRLPPWWPEDAEFEQRVELNEIVLRACEGDTVRRYHTARELLADLALVASGRSVKRMRGLERRLRILKWVAVLIAAVALTSLGVSSIWRQQADRERTLRERAEKAENAEREAKLKAMLDQVHAARHNQGTGVVADTLAVARKAAAARVTPELRDDTVFLLGRGDFVPRPDLAFPYSPSHPYWAIDADSLLMAEIPRSAGAEAAPLTVNLHTAGVPEKMREIRVDSAPPGLTILQFSRGGGRLLITGEYGPGIVLDTATGKVIGGPYPYSYPCGTPLAFCGDDGAAVIRRSADGGLAIFPVTGERRTTPPVQDWPLRDQSLPGVPRHRVWPSPDGRFVLLVDNKLKLSAQGDHGEGGAACLVEVASGRVLWKVRGPDEQVAAWSPDGTRIAVRQGYSIVSLDAATGKPAGYVPGRIHNGGTQLVFLDSRDLLAFSTWSMHGYCDLTREEVLGRAPVQEHWAYSRTHRLLFSGTGTVEWRPSPVLRVIPPQMPRRAPIFLGFSPDDQWLVSGNGSQFLWWKSGDRDCAPAAVTPAHNAGGIVFAPGKGTVQLLDNGGRHELPWTGEPPASLPDPLPFGPGAVQRSEYASASRDGTTTAFGGDRYVIVWREGQAPRPFPTEDAANPVNVSPDGHWLAIGAHRRNELRIFNLDAPGGEPVHREHLGPGNCGAFSPDGKWLVCSSLTENRILETTNWTVVHRRPRRSSSLLGHISFDREGRYLSVMDTMSSCAILEPGTWRPLFHLDSPLDEIFERNLLSPGGRYFAAVGTRGEIYVWNLEALEHELTALSPALSPRR